MAKFKRSKDKTVYKKTKSKELPRNYRIIPEKLITDGSVFLLGLFCILAAIALVGLDLTSNVKRQKKLDLERNELNREVGFWQKQTNLHPSYRDAYFSLALLDYQLRDLNEASSNLGKALLLDPNFKAGEEFNQILNSKE